MSDLKILFKYATRSRPENFIRGLESIANNYENDNASILISIDEDDESMQEYAGLKLSMNNCSLKFISGKSKNKVDAINRDMGFAEPWDILIAVSDDMVFKKKGFDNDIRESFGSNLDQCLHFPDGNRNDLITMSIMGRDYYNRFGYIYHPDYVSLYCDNEQTDVAKKLGCYKYVDKQIFEHLHPAYGKAVFDAQYQHTESFNEVDRITYLRRKGMNFGL